MVKLKVELQEMKCVQSAVCMKYVYILCLSTHTHREQLSSILAEQEELLVDHDQLASRHQQLLQESSERQEQLQRRWVLVLIKSFFPDHVVKFLPIFREPEHEVTTHVQPCTLPHPPPLRLEAEESRHQSLSLEQSELILQLRREIMEVTSAFKQQLHQLQEEHQRTTTALREELKVRAACWAVSSSETQSLSPSSLSFSVCTTAVNTVCATAVNAVCATAINTVCVTAINTVCVTAINTVFTTEHCMCHNH